MCTRRVASWLSLATCFTLCGCASNLTYERWATLHQGATPETVEATLGEPWQKADGTWVYHDPDRGITASIFFEHDTMIGKEWADPDRGIAGSNPRVTQPGDAEEIRVQRIEEAESH